MDLIVAEKQKQHGEGKCKWGAGLSRTKNWSGEECGVDESLKAGGV